jgi:hypothetical protein
MNNITIQLITTKFIYTNPSDEVFIKNTLTGSVLRMHGDSNGTHISKSNMIITPTTINGVSAIKVN